MTKKWLKEKQLRERYGGVSHMWIVRKLASDPTFPRPIRLGSGRLKFWDESRLEEWEGEQAKRSR
jgi:predicted DNA-binding transcriptional regulator AlpA